MSPRALRGGLALWAVVVAFLTLVPSTDPAPHLVADFLCLWCGERSSGDMVLNLFLFLPAGLLLGGLVDLRQAVVVGVVGTMGIEAAQAFIPGRTPSLTDLILNGAGTALGAYVVGRARVRPFLWGIAALSAAAWILPAALMSPHSTGTTLFGLWVPDFSHMARYEGEVLQARVDGRPAQFRLEESPTVARALVQRRPVRITLVAGRQPQRLAPVFAVYDEDENVHLMVATLGEDILVRPRTHATALRLDQPDLRARGALLGVHPGDTVRMQLRVEARRRCLEVEERVLCDLAPGAGDGYGFLLNLEGAPAWARTGLAWAWSFTLGLAIALPLAFLPWTAATIRLLGAGLGGALGLAQVGLASTLPDLALRPWQLVFFLVGTVCAGVLAPWVADVVPARRKEGEGGDEPVPSEDPAA